MKKAVFIIHSDILQPVPIEKVVQAKAPKLDQLQKAVGGYIETVPHFTNFEYMGKKYTRGTAYCNEEGLLEGLPFNPLATQAWLRCLGDKPLWYKPRLHGDVIFYATEKD